MTQGPRMRNREVGRRAIVGAIWVLASLAPLTVARAQTEEDPARPLLDDERTEVEPNAAEEAPEAPTPQALPAANAASQPAALYAPYPASSPAIPSFFEPEPFRPATEMRSPALLGVGIGLTTVGAALSVTGGALLGGGADTGWPGVFTLIPGGIILATGIPMIAVGASRAFVEPSSTSSASRYKRLRNEAPDDTTEMRAPGMTGVGITLIALGGISATGITASIVANEADVDSEIWGLNGASLAALAGGIAMTVHGTRQDRVGEEVMRSPAAVHGGMIMVTAGAMLTSSMTFGLVADAVGDHFPGEHGFWGTPVALAGGVVLMGSGLPLVIWGSGDPERGDEERASDLEIPPEVRVGPTGLDVKWRF